MYKVRWHSNEVVVVVKSYSSLVFSLSDDPVPVISGHEFYDDWCWYSLACVPRHWETMADVDVSRLERWI